MMITIPKSYLSNRIKKTYNLKIGDFYYFENFVVVEYAEGSVVSMDALKVIIEKSLTHFPDDKNFGLIVNKINSYNTIPTDAFKLESKIPNLKAIAVVSYNVAQNINFGLENHFFKSIHRKMFQSLEDAEKWIQAILNKSA